MFPVYAAYRYEQEAQGSTPIYSWGVVRLVQSVNTGEITATLLCLVADDELGITSREISNAMNATLA